MDPEYRGNSLSRVDVLIDTLSRFLAALIEEGQLAAEREARIRARKSASQQSAPDKAVSTKESAEKATAKKVVTGETVSDEVVATA